MCYFLAVPLAFSLGPPPLTCYCDLRRRVQVPWEHCSVFLLLLPVVGEVGASSSYSPSLLLVCRCRMPACCCFLLCHIAGALWQWYSTHNTKRRAGAPLYSTVSHGHGPTADNLFFFLGELLKLHTRPRSSFTERTGISERGLPSGKRRCVM